MNPWSRRYAKAGHGDLTVETLDTDHVFSGRRIALAHIVINWLNSQCRQLLATG